MLGDKLVKTTLQGVIDDLLSKHALKGYGEFVDFLENNAAIVAEIHDAAKSDCNVHFIQSMQDGWYCIDQGDDCYKVYHQERGCLGWGQKLVEGKCKAITEVLEASCYLSI